MDIQVRRHRGIRTSATDQQKAASAPAACSRYIWLTWAHNGGLWIVLKSTVCTNANTAPSARAFFFLRSLLFQCGKSLFLSPEVLPLMGGWSMGQRPNIHYQTNTGALRQVVTGDVAFFSGTELKAVCAHANKTNRWVRKKNMYVLHTLQLALYSPHCNWPVNLRLSALLLEQGGWQPGCLSAFLTFPYYG